jgi:TetR/AcrR family transcriptional repressor of multidrug resistance operon
MRTRDADKEQLVKQKAVELLVKYGFEGFSVNKLAKACNISVATLYIYYQDKDDLIIQIAKEEAGRMNAAMLKDFDPDATFEAGLRVQWQNRYQLLTENPLLHRFFEQLRGSTYQRYVYENIMGDFKTMMGKFVKNAITRGEIKELPIAVFWSLAFAPFYSLIRFHNEGKTIDGQNFTLTHKMLWQTFELVLKTLKK